jgi:hypothetical protein
VPGAGGYNLPKEIANNPKAYAELISGQYTDPWAAAEALGSFKDRALASSNGLIVMEEADKKNAALGALIAMYGNQRRRQSLEEAMGTPDPYQTVPRRAVQGIGDWLQQQGQPQTTPMPTGMQGPPEPVAGTGSATAQGLGDFLQGLGGYL